MTKEPTVDALAFDTDEDRFGSQDPHDFKIGQIVTWVGQVWEVVDAAQQGRYQVKVRPANFPHNPSIWVDHRGVKLCNADTADDTAPLTRAEVGHLLAEAQVAANQPTPGKAWSDPEQRENFPTCAWCEEEVGIIHYGDGDRWQPTPALGDDFCFDRWDQTSDKPAMFCEETLARESGQFRHEIEESA